MISLRLATVAALFALFLAHYGQAQSVPVPVLSDRVLVVYNDADHDSERVAKYYMSRRGIPAENVCRFSSNPSSVNQGDFESAIKPRIRKCLEKVGKDKILYIVLSYATPFDVVINGFNYAVDQFLADIWDDFLPDRPAAQNEVQPYFGEAQSQGGVYQPYVPFSEYRSRPGAHLIYSVWRVDGPTPEIANGLVDKALFAETHGLTGLVCIDRQYPQLEVQPDTSYTAGEWDLYEAAEFARKAGFNVLEDKHDQEFGTPPAALRCDNAALYAGWYSLNHYNDAFSWNPGAIGIHLDSGSAEDPRKGTNWAANALLRGITVTSGAVWEPYLDNLPHPDQAFLYLFEGANVGDALLRSTRMLKWRIINIGDPLYRPFPGGVRIANPPTQAVLGLSPPIALAGQQTRAVVGITRPAPPGGITFTVKSTRPDLVKVPASVMIPEQTNHAVFPVQVGDISEDRTAVLISISAPGLNRSNTLIAFPYLQKLTLSAAQAKPGGTLNGTVALVHTAPEGGIHVALAVDNAGASVPESVDVPAGQLQATFTVQVHSATAESKVTITATHAGAKRQATFQLTP